MELCRKKLQERASYLVFWANSASIRFGISQFTASLLRSCSELRACCFRCAGSLCSLSPGGLIAADFQALVHFAKNFGSLVTAYGFVVHG